MTEKWMEPYIGIDMPALSSLQINEPGITPIKTSAPHSGTRVCDVLLVDESRKDALSTNHSSLLYCM